MEFNAICEYSNLATPRSNNRVIIIRGVAGSGKSTFAKSFVDVDSNVQVFEADQYFYSGSDYNFDPTKLHQAHSDCFRRFSNYLDNNNNVTAIVANTNIKHGDMKKYIKYALNMNLTLMVFKMCTEYGSIHNVPETALDRMRNNFQEFNIERFK